MGVSESIDRFRGRMFNRQASMFGVMGQIAARPIVSRRHALAVGATLFLRRPVQSGVQWHPSAAILAAHPPTRSGSSTAGGSKTKTPTEPITCQDIQVQKRLGVLRLDGWSNPNVHDKDGHGTTGATAPEDGNKDNKYQGYVPLEGDIDAEGSYDFDFISELAEGCTFEALCDPENFKNSKKINELSPGVETAVKKLVERGAQAIIGNCGLFMWLHATGVIEHAVDKVMKDLGSVYGRPTVMLSSLTTLGSTLATLGVGTAQKEASAFWRNSDGEVKTRECKVVVYTSNGDSCKALLNAIPQLQGVKIITPYDEEEGDVLVVGLNGVVNGKERQVIGLEGRPGNGQVGGDSVNGFVAVKTGQPVFYDIVQPDMELVAKAVKQKFPSVCQAYVECTEVSSYSDTIRLAMQVPVFDPINLANDMIGAANNHNFHQVSNFERQKQVSATLRMPVNELVQNKIVDALDVGTYSMYAVRSTQRCPSPQ